LRSIEASEYTGATGRTGRRGGVCFLKTHTYIKDTRLSLWHKLTEFTGTLIVGYDEQYVWTGISKYLDSSKEKKNEDKPQRFLCQRTPALPQSSFL
jgi:hypothetical protein